MSVFFFAQLPLPHITLQNATVIRQATRPGDSLLDGETCKHCRPETGGLGAAATDLTKMVDVLQSRGTSQLNLASSNS